MPLFAAAVSVTASARAQDVASGLESAESAFADGRFDEARELLDRLAEGAGLDTVEQVRALLVLRVRVGTAIRDEDAVERDLRRLAVIQPQRALPESVPPDVHARFAEIVELVEPLELELTQEEVFGGVVLRARVRPASSGLVRAVRIYARTPGGEWLASEDEVMRVTSPPGSVVEYYATFLGPGGAVLGSEGSPDRPRRAHSLGAVDARSSPAAPIDDRTQQRATNTSDPWPVILGVAIPLVVLAGAAVGLGVHFGSQRDGAATELAPPMIRW